MSGSSLAVLERRLEALAAQLQPPAAPLSALDIAGRLGLELDDWQIAAAASGATRLALNVTRQGGKSTLAALLGLEELLRPNTLTLAVSPGLRQSALLFRKIATFYRRLGSPVPALVENRLSLELSNGSALYALPAASDQVRGFSAVSLLLVDEASRVGDDLFAAVSPMLAVSGGRIWTMSTPCGRRGWWWQMWSEGGADWERYEVPASAIRRIPPAFLEQERRALPAMVYAAEYECQFVDDISQFFRTEDVLAMASAEVKPLFPEVSTDAA